MTRDTATVFWMRILRLILDGSVERYDRKKAAIKALSPLNEPGQDVSAYCTKVKPLVRELLGSKAFDWNLILYIVQALCQVTVETFRATFLPLALVIDAELRDTMYMELEAREIHMTNLGYHPRQLLEKAENMYLSVKGRDQWGPALNVKDSTGINLAKVNLACMDAAQINKLVQSRVNKGVNQRLKKGLCRICGQPGHWAEDHDDATAAAANPKTANIPAATETPPRGGRHSPSWRHKPPKPEDKDKPMIRNGKTYYWCEFCDKTRGGRWTLTHCSKDHKHKTDPNSNPQGNLAGQSASGLAWQY